MTTGGQTRTWEDLEDDDGDTDADADADADSATCRSLDWEENLRGNDEFTAKLLLERHRQQT